MQRPDHRATFVRPRNQRVGDDLAAARAARANEDLDLLAAARAGDDAAVADLLNRYRGLAQTRSRSYFLAGADDEDVLQEAMIGVYKAVRDFDPQLGTPFPAFADICVQRQLISAITAATRHKHRPLTTAISLSTPVGAAETGSGSATLADVLVLPGAVDPAEEVIAAARFRALREHLARELSELEIDVLRQHVQGRSYAEIAGSVRRQVKAVDNALQRVRHKVQVHLQDLALAEAG